MDFFQNKLSPLKKYLFSIHLKRKKTYQKYFVFIKRELVLDGSLSIITDIPPWTNDNVKKCFYSNAKATEDAVSIKNLLDPDYIT